MPTEVIIPETPAVLLKEDDKPIEDNFSINELQNKLNSIKQDDLDTPASPNSLVPPPPYSQWDQLSIKQLLEKSQEMLDAEYLANGGDKKEKDGEVLDKVTQLESLVSSLQSILNDQTFAMHDLRSQLSDIQVVLKKMQDKQEIISSEEIMKQVITMKALTENIIASSEVKKQLDVNAAKQQPLQQEEEVASENEKKQPSPSGDSVEPLQQEKEVASENEKKQPPPSGERQPAPIIVPTMSIVPPMSRSVSKQPSRAVSRAPSRNHSRPSSRSVSRTVSPACTPVVLSRSSSKIDSSASPNYKVNEFPTINENNENCEDDEFSNEDTSLDRMINNIKSLLTEATEAVELPIKGREKDRTFSSISASSIDFDEINRQLDDIYGEDEEEYEEEEEEEDEPIEMGNSGLRPEDAEFSSKEARWPKKHKRTKSGSNKDDFLKSLNSFSNSMTGLESLIEGFTEELVQEDEGDAMTGIQYRVPTNELINNPSSDVPDLDDFAQQCRLLTRALILPFLHATHSFMSESLQTTNIQAPRSVTSTTRTFMNLMYWTFLFTLGSLVLDAWLCEVAGRQVIRVVEQLKPGQPFGIIANGYGGYGTIDVDQQDGGIGMLEDGKKKNVKFRTGPKMKAVTWKGAEKGVVGNGGKWWREGAEGFLSLGRRGGRFLTGGRWDARSTVGRFEDEEYSEESDEWEIVDFDSSEEDSLSEEEGNYDDPALLLRRRIANERSRRAGHVNCAHENDAKKEEAVNNDVSSIKDQEYDIQDENLSRTINNSEDSKINTLTEESEDDDYIEYDDDLIMPGSFPTAFKWTPPPSTMVENITDRVRRVRSVVLRKPKRNGPFGGSGGFWIMNTRKVRTINNDKKNTTKSSNKSSSKKDKSSKSSPIQKRTWVRRNSI